MTESLNVNKNNLNNKRLSRLQGVILKVLATSYPADYRKRTLSKIVAGLYGKGSLITQADLETELEAKAKQHPDKTEIIYGLDFIMSARKRNRYITQDGWAGEWISPKFSVSYSRSIRDLLNQQLVAYMLTTDNNWAIFITDKGSAKIQSRNLKVNAKFGDVFQASLKDKQTGADSQS